MYAKFIITRTVTGNFSFELIAANGNKVLNGGQYSGKSCCQQAIRSVKESAADLHRFEKKNTINGQHYFIIKDNRSTILATSELYWSPSSRDYAMILTKRESASALLELLKPA